MSQFRKKRGESRQLLKWRNFRCGLNVLWIIDLSTEIWMYLRVIGAYGISVVSIDGQAHGFTSSTAELMARGVYCLGFEDQSVLTKLPILSAHEKLELREQMARECWPQKWLDEAGE